MIVRTHSAPGRGTRISSQSEDPDADLDRRVRQFMLDTGETDYTRAFNLVCGDPAKRPIKAT